MFDAYILCGTPRTGSTLLCDLLTATGIAGRPDSFFMRDIDPVWARELGLPAAGEPGYDASYLAAVIRAGTGETGMFGLRLMRENLEDMTSLLDRLHPGLPSDSARIGAAFGRVLFLHLRREDKLAQAVSLIKAEQTGLWHIAPDGRELERLAPPSEPAYDHGRIARKLAELEALDAAWEPWFAREGITPLRIGYEGLSADPAGAVRRICAALGVAEPDPATLRPGVARLADAVSAEWITRFRAETAGA